MDALRQNHLLSYNYSDFGQTTRTGDQEVLSEVAYIGGIHDTSTELYYLNARHYDPASARFTARDSARNGGGVNAGFSLYGYCEGNPIGKTDPTGLWSKANHVGSTKNAGGSAHTRTGVYQADAHEKLGGRGPFHGKRAYKTNLKRLYQISAYYKRHGKFPTHKKYKTYKKYEKPLLERVTEDPQGLGIKSAKATTKKAKADRFFGATLHLLQDIYAHNVVVTEYPEAGLLGVKPFNYNRLLNSEGLLVTGSIHSLTTWQLKLSYDEEGKMTLSMTSTKKSYADNVNYMPQRFALAQEATKLMVSGYKKNRGYDKYWLIKSHENVAGSVRFSTRP